MGMAAGVPVEGDSGSTIEDLAHNNNLLYARYSGVLFNAGSHAGVAPGVATWVPLYRLPVPGSRDAIGLEVEIECDDGGSAADLKIENNAATKSATFGSFGPGAGRSIRTLSLGSTTADDDTYGISGNGADLRIYSVTVRWAPNKTATLASLDPTASGFRFVSTSINAGNPYETDANRAVADEMLNRMFGNPRAIWEDRRIAHVCLGTDISSSTPWTNATRTPVAGPWCHLRYPCKLRWLAYTTTAAATWELRITDTLDPDNPVLFTQASPTANYGGVGWLSQTIDAEMGEREYTVELTGAAPDYLSLWTLVAFPESP